MFAYLYANILFHICWYEYIHINVCVLEYVCMNIYYIHINVHVFGCICRNIYILMCISGCICMNLYMLICVFWDVYASQNIDINNMYVGPVTIKDMQTPPPPPPLEVVETL